MIPAPLGLALHETRMHQALRQAQRAAEAGEVPVGAVIYSSGRLVGQAWNQTRTLKDPTAHAEILAITQAASAAGDWRLTDSILYVTKEPCPMCAGAIVLARIPLVVWGMSDPLRGGAISRFQILQTAELNHRAEVIAGVLEEECTALIKGFFKQRRLENKGGDELG
ncbi:MAG: tRNA adenosine(34) deaminase TadA [Kiritimatiellia bacterium]|jgi:tRNA(adenine34) deaminase|nr:tRNA adenosine(34) deaminase TadA [Kiritimatiellia bacterium]